MFPDGRHFLVASAATMRIYCVNTEDFKQLQHVNKHDTFFKANRLSAMRGISISHDGRFVLVCAGEALVCCLEVQQKTENGKLVLVGKRRW